MFPSEPSTRTWYDQPGCGSPRNDLGTRIDRVSPETCWRSSSGTNSACCISAETFACTSCIATSVRPVANTARSQVWPSASSARRPGSSSLKPSPPVST